MLETAVGESRVTSASCIVLLSVLFSQLGAGCREARAPAPALVNRASDAAVGLTTSTTPTSPGGRPSSEPGPEVAPQCVEPEPIEMAWDTYTERSGEIVAVTCEGDLFTSIPEETGVRIKLDQAAHLWASAGPAPHLEFDGRDEGVVRLSLERGSPCRAGGSILAEGAALGVDLEPGEYTLTAAFWPLGLNQYATVPTLAYRFSAPGSTSCPTEFAAKGLPNWQGESPINPRSIGDLDHDGVPDTAIEYRASAMGQSGTRLVAARPYPSCGEVVFDGAASVSVVEGNHAGWSKLELSRTIFHPIDDRRVGVTQRAAYDPSWGRYVPGAFLHCFSPTEEDSVEERRVRERSCMRALRAGESRGAPHADPAEAIRLWLSSDERHQARPLTASLAAARNAYRHTGLDFWLEEPVACEPGFGSTEWIVPVNVVGAEENCSSYERRAGASLEDAREKLVGDEFVFTLKQQGGRLEVTDAALEPPCKYPNAGSSRSPYELDEAVDSWISSPWTSSRPTGQRTAELRAAHRNLYAAREHDALISTDLYGCATESPEPLWLWVGTVDETATQAPATVRLLLRDRSGTPIPVGVPPFHPRYCASSEVE